MDMGPRGMTKHVQVNDNKKTSQNRRAGADACDGGLVLDL